MPTIWWNCHEKTIQGKDYKEEKSNEGKVYRKTNKTKCLYHDALKHTKLDLVQDPTVKKRCINFRRILSYRGEKKNQEFTINLLK